MFPYHRIAVALARTSADADLVRYAAMLAGMDRDDPIEFSFVHVLGPEAETEHSAAAAEIEGGVNPVFAAINGGASHNCTVLSGSRVDRLLEFTADGGYDLLLVGHQRTRRGRRSLARRLAMNAPCSLWMVPEGAAASLRGILTAVDYSTHSALALSTASAVAHSAGVEECPAVHVFFDQVAAMSDSFAYEMRQRNNENFAQFTAPLNLHGRRFTPFLEASPSIARGIIQSAQQRTADLIVMGTRGLTASMTVLLGSETEQVILESPIPVLIVKYPGERIGFLKALLDRDFGSGITRRFA